MMIVIRTIFAGILIFGLPSLSEAANSLNFYNNYFVPGDYAVAGVGLRATGVAGVATANITISGIPSNADVIAAFLYWQTLDNTQTVNSQTVCGNPNPTASFNKLAITPVQVAFAPSVLQSQNCVATFRADVFGLLNVQNAKQIPNGTYEIKVPDSGNSATAPSTEGASLIVIYRAPGASFKSIVIYDGTAVVGPRLNFSATIQGFYQASVTTPPHAKVTYLVGDGQAPNGHNQMSFNGTAVLTDAATGSAGPLWDNLTTDVSAYVPAGASQVTASSTFVTDAITFSAVVFSTTVQDTDGDGLLDIWETNGYTDMTDGSFINLPAMGANPNVKDIFVEIDWMVAAGHSHQPKTAALAKIVAGFQGALGGPINIHFDYGQGGLYTGGNAITEVLPTQWKWDTAHSPGFLTIKNANFNRNRRHIFHYSLWAHQRPDHPDPSNPGGPLIPNSASGIADLPGSDSMITLGLWRHPGSPDDQVGTLEEQAGTMMHELGHNLNLQHGGADSLNCKPDYQSIMSYAYQVIGLSSLNGTVYFDYSRQLLPSLNENTLDETAGLGSTTYRARWFAPANNLDILLNRQTVTRYCDGTLRASPVVALDSNAVSGPLNWDNDVNGVISPLTVAVDVNDSGLNDSYSGYNDWQNIDLHQVSSGFAFSEGEIANIDGEIANGEIANFENGEIANIADGEIANFDTNGEIDFNLAQSLAVPPSPTFLVSRVAAHLVRLAWNPVRQTNVVKCQVFRFNTTTGSLATATLIGSVIGAPPVAPIPLYNDTTVVAGTSYSYFVNAVDDQGHNSQISNIIVVLAQ
jgi:hypothetical protein